MKSSKNYLFFREYQIEIFAASETDRHGMKAMWRAWGRIWIKMHHFICAVRQLEIFITNLLVLFIFLILENCIWSSKQCLPSPRNLVQCCAFLPWKKQKSHAIYSLLSLQLFTNEREKWVQVQINCCVWLFPAMQYDEIAFSGVFQCAVEMF